MRSEEIFSRLASRVLFLTCDLSTDDQAQASGVLVSADGFFVTNAHVVEGCQSLSATYISGSSRRTYRAQLKYYDKKSDTSVLKIEGRGFDFFNLIARKAHVGERVYAIGNPRGLEQSMSEGIVSGLRDDDGTPWIQHSAPISPGNSGGALISSRGELLGINSFHLEESQNLNFAVPASTLEGAYRVARAAPAVLGFPGVPPVTPSGAAPSPPGVPPSPSEPGDAVSQDKLGNAYFLGEGVQQDYAEAARLYRKSADQGYAPAQSNLGAMYFSGRGVTRDYAEAAKLFRKAADQGDAWGQVDLGVRYFLGQGVTQDYAEALKWYRKAANQGNSAAKQNLGISFAAGKGVAQDYVLAHMWYSLAALQSAGQEQKHLAELIDSLEAKMAPTQISEAQRLAREWKPAPSDNTPPMVR
jgi:TPR repeat protein